jgi:hypothetical protein
MRTTVTLDPDTEALIRRRMKERNLSFKQVLNDAIREGLTQSPGGEEVSTPTVDMGLPRVNLDRALALASELEDEELVRKAQVGR